MTLSGGNTIICLATNHYVDMAHAEKGPAKYAVSAGNTNLKYVCSTNVILESCRWPPSESVDAVAGKWYVKATDGSVKIMGPGDVLFQDDVKNSPAKKTPGHWSGYGSTCKTHCHFLKCRRMFLPCMPAATALSWLMSNFVALLRVVGDWPCQQMVIQVSRKPEVDRPGSL